MLDGRVKTMHPLYRRPILAVRAQNAERHGGFGAAWDCTDQYYGCVVNLYDFAAVAADPGPLSLET
jgi:AICAR transformylase/IMP cyclohydrolase PurH